MGFKKVFSYILLSLIITPILFITLRTIWLYFDILGIAVSLVVLFQLLILINQYTLKAKLNNIEDLLKKQQSV